MINKNCVIIIVSLFLGLNSKAIEKDSIFFKKKFHTIEACVGISPKAKSSYVSSSKGYTMYGLWHDYSVKLQNNFYFSVPVNFLMGGDCFSNYEQPNDSSFYFEEVKREYSLLNMGIGLKYLLYPFKNKKNALIFQIGDLVSYKYTYRITGTTIWHQSITYSDHYNYRFQYDDRINDPLGAFSMSFPFFLKISLEAKRIIFSITEYGLTHESAYGSINRFYTNLNIGIIL